MTDQIQRVETVLQEIDHLEYVDVSDGVTADVLVATAPHMDNAQVNNGMMAAFHVAGFVVHHIDHDAEEVELRDVR